MKFGQLIEYNKNNVFLQRSCRKSGRETSSRPLFFLKKLYMRLKQVVCSLVLRYFGSPLAYNKNKLYKNLRLLIQRHAQFWAFRKGLGIVSPPHFVDDFSRKMLFMLYSINWPNFIVRLLLLFEILGNICIVIVCLPSCDVTNSKITLIFLIKPFF